MAYTQEDVNNWFAANPNATPEFVAQTVQQAGGLDAHQGLAGMIGQHYGTDANTITAGYNSLITPAAPVAPVTPAAQPLAAPVVPVAPVTSAAPVTPPISQIQTAVDKWKTNNPTATPQQMANAIAVNGGLTPEVAQAVAQAYGTDVNTITTGYNQLNPYSQIESLYKNKDYTGINSLIGQSGLTTEQIQNQFGLTNEQLNQARDLGINLNYMTPEIQRLVESTLADEELSPTLQINKILETGQKYGFGESDLEKLYGKETVASALNTYKTGINDYLTETLAKDAGTTLNEVGEIHRAAQKYGMTPAEIAKYGGMDIKTVQSYFNAYDQGLVNLMAALKDPQYSETQRTAIALDAAQKYGTTDAELAKASKGKYTEKDIAEYLDPVRNVPVNLNKLFADPNATAADINKFITEAKADPRAAGIYGVALDKVVNDPQLYLRDAISGKGDISDSYDAFLTKAKATPELATKYADEIKAIETAKSYIAKHALNKDFGGEYKDYAMQMFLGLDKNTTKQAPKQLEFGEPTTKKATALDPATDSFYEYDVSVPPAPKEKGVEPIYETSYGDGDSTTTLTGYRKKIDSDEFGGQPVYATYDANGKHTGYESTAKVYTGKRQYYGAKWDADGSPAPYGVQESRGGLGGFVDSIMSDPIFGSLATMGASYLGGPLGVAALQAAAGRDLEDIGKSMALSYVGGQVGNQVSGATAGTLGEFGSQAAGQFAGNTAAGILSGKDLDFGNMALSSLINAGVDIGGNKLLGESGIATLGVASPYAKALTSDLLSSAVSGQNPDLVKTITNTAIKEAMKSGKEQLKTAKAP